MRWLYHVTRGELAAGPEGFVHCSFRDDVRESVRLHFTNISPGDLRVIRVDPRRVPDVRVEGPRSMPHVYGGVPRDAIAEILPLDAIDSAPDAVRGTRFAVVGDPPEPLLRVVSMDVDRDASVEVVAPGAPLDSFDVLVLGGGLERDDPWVRTFPAARRVAASADALELVGWLYGDEARARIAARMEYPAPPR